MLILFFTITGCANMLPPTGGQRDSLPPKIVRSIPENLSRNFNGKKIILTFDEFVTTQNIQENLIISPLPKTMPILEAKLNTVTLKFKDSLEKNTTYSIYFGKSITDVNEGNALKDYLFIFSTGNNIDSLELKGKVILAETGGIDSTMIVMLHTNKNDSSVVNETPKYFSKINTKGEFYFTHLPHQIFYVYALKDEGGSKRYFNRNQLFAFYNIPINITSNTPEIQLYAYALPNEKKSKPNNPNTNQGKNNSLKISFTNSLQENNKQDLFSPFVLTFSNKLKYFDSTLLNLFSDSSYTKVKNYYYEFDSLNKKIILYCTWEENKKYELVMYKNFTQDSLGKQLLKNDTLHFVSKSKLDYGQLTIHFKQLDLSKKPVLLFYKNNILVKSSQLKSNIFKSLYFEPGEYELRILSDTNENGIWDAGKFFNQHIQPEIVKKIERNITIKAKWENEFEIEFPLFN